MESALPPRAHSVPLALGLAEQRGVTFCAESDLQPAATPAPRPIAQTLPPSPLARRCSSPRAQPDGSLTGSPASEPVHAALHGCESKSPSSPRRGPGGRLRTSSNRQRRSDIQVRRVRNETKAKTPPTYSDTIRILQPVQDRTRKRPHRGVRSLLSRALSRDHRRETRRIRRSQFRRSKRARREEQRQEWFSISELTLARQLEQTTEARDANRAVHRPKNSAEKLCPNENIFVWHLNIEGVAYVGRLAELLYCMHTRDVLLACLSEAKCSGSSTFRSGDYLVLQSGGKHPCSAGVAFVLHKQLVASLYSFTPRNERIAVITLKIVGGLLTIIAVYLPYESTEQGNADMRADAYADLEEVILEAARHGPFLVVGDFNTSVRYRREEEREVIGPYMYSPLPAALQTVADGAPASITEPTLRTARFFRRCASAPKPSSRKHSCKNHRGRR